MKGNYVIIKIEGCLLFIHPPGWRNDNQDILYLCMMHSTRGAFGGGKEMLEWSGFLERDNQSGTPTDRRGIKIRGSWDTINIK